MPESPPQPITPPAPTGSKHDRLPSDAQTFRLDDPTPVLDPSRPTIALPEAAAAGERQHDSRDFEGEPFGRYRLLVELGRGGMGVVHKAWDTQLRRVVALKQVLGEGGLTRAQVDRFLREARLAARLRHPNVVGVLDVAEHEGRPYLTTEFLEARSLEVVMRQPVEASQALRWVKAIAEALQCAHDLGIVHRDVKPSNVLIDVEGRPFLTDFGLAKEVENVGPGGTTLTLSGSLVGTPQYMSPEQASGRPERIGPAADQFSLGVVLYELLTGKIPFDGDGLRELLNAISEREPVPPRRLRGGIDRDAETICLKALEKDPARRYARIGDFAEDVGRLLVGEPIRARPRSLFESAGRVVSRHRRIAAAIVAAAALLVAFGVPALRDRDRRAEEARAERDALNRAAAEKEAALRKAQANLEKAGRVQNVLARWTLLADEVRDLEAIAYDQRASPDERERKSKPVWRKIERFLEETPDEPTSRAVARALAGWARRLAGYEEEGHDWMREAQRADPDLPHGALMEALVWFSEYVVLHPLPYLTTRPEGIEFGPMPPENARMRRAREECERLLEEAARARVWGEGLDREFRAALEAVRALQAGRLEEAEQGLTLSIGCAAMQACEADLLFARAKVRYLLRRFRDGLEDMDRVAERRPRYDGVWMYRGVLWIGAGVMDAREGKDPVPAYDQALECLDKAAELRRDALGVVIYRVIALGRKGEAEGRKGKDPRPTLDEAIRICDELVAVAPDDAAILFNRSGLLVRRGEAEEMACGDPLPWFDGALRDAEAVTRLDPRSDSALIARAMARWCRALAAKGKGEDSQAALREAIGDLDEAIARAPEDSVARTARGEVLNDLAAARAARGEDPTEACRDALRDLDEALRMSPDDLETLVARGKTHRLLGEQASASKADPEPHFARALADFDRAILVRPSSSDAWNERGLTRTAVGFGRMMRGEEALQVLHDATEDFKKAVELNPGSLVIRSNRGVALTRFGEARGHAGMDPTPDFQDAIAQYDVILEQNPRYPAAWQHRALVRIALAGVVRVKGGNADPVWEASLKDLERLQELDPSGWRAPGTRGLVYERMGRKEEAIRAYEEALKLCPGHPGVRAQLEALRKR